jgi:PAS domain S-box-containing protein
MMYEQKPLLRARHERLLLIDSQGSPMAKKCTYEELEQKIKELEALKAQRRQGDNDLDKFFNLSIDMLCIADMEGYFKVINESFEKTLRYSKEELYAHPFIHFVHPDDVSLTIRALEQLSHDKPVTYFENRYRCKDGSYKWLAWTSMPVAAEGIMYAIARDVTAIKQAEQIIKESKSALEQRVQERTIELWKANELLEREIKEHKQVSEELLASNKRFEDLAENSTDVIWEFDEHDIFTYVSPRIENLLGYTPEEIVGQSAFDPMPTTEKQQVRKKFSVYKNARRPFTSLINVNQHKNGTQVILESSGIPVFDKEGVFRGYRGIDRDITERTKLSEQLQQSQKMEAMGTLAGGIAHDFNNILAAIMGYTEMSIDETPQDSLVRHNLGQVLVASLRARDLVKQILAFSRKGEKERIPVQLSSLVKETSKLLRASIPATIEIKQKIMTSALIMADPIQIHQVLMNLSTNASDAMLDTGGVLEIEVCESAVAEKMYVHDQVLLPGKYVRISVKDTGCGIAPEVIGRIFDPFFTTKAVGKGTGMGLAVVHGIVHSHGGALTVKSTKGRGTTFELFFPMVEQAVCTQEAPEAALPLGNETILFVDDEKILRDVVTQMIESFGYTVVSLKSGMEALEIFQKDPQRFDLVVTDQSMPKMTGYDLSKKLIEIKPGIPVILCTGYSETVSLEKAKNAGIKEFIMKPIRRNEIAWILRKVLDAKD